jgi:hypothetical protein
MKFSMEQSKYVTGRKFLIVLAVTSLLGSLSIAPAFADHGRVDRRGGHDRVDHGRRGWGGWGYAQPVYAPPVVYAAPVQSPGISLILPIHIR